MFNFLFFLMSLLHSIPFRSYWNVRNYNFAFYSVLYWSETWSFIFKEGGQGAQEGGQGAQEGGQGAQEGGQGAQEGG